MQELNMIEVEEVSGGLAFLPMLFTAFGGGVAAGYLWGLVEKHVSK